MIVSIDVEDRGWEAIPALEELTRGAIDAAAAMTHAPDAEVNVLFTGDLEIAEINKEWRGKPQPTNVLSFPAEDFPVPPGEAKPLGDIVLAFGTVAREAQEQGKTLPHHTQHLIVHGFLHLLGHDHEDDAEAEAMEGLERDILKGLGISDPYERQ